MDARSIELLELPAVLDRLAGETTSAPGRALALALRPSPDPAEVARRLRETAEAIELRRLGIPLPGGAEDVSAVAEAAARGGLLEPPDLGDVLTLCRVACELSASVLGASVDVPELAAAGRLVVTPALDPLGDRLDAALDGRGGLRDDASAGLAAARRGLAAARRDVDELLRRLVGSLGAHLQERFVTERGGRPVLAVKASSRSAVRGIVHDSSGSGQTLFVEPFEVVEASNRVRELEGREREEVALVLADLSRRVGEAHIAIADAVEGVAVIDLALARAGLATRMDARPAGGGADAALHGARHPLLDPRSVVPVDLDLGKRRALVVTGPNTGGKTVALKTLGLLALMSQCGMWVPAREARLPVFDEILADIGDEQSIAESLSTFSGHLRRVVEVIGRAGERSLVLIDEIMAGTDPAEGAALAIAILERLLDRGALVLVTSHSADLKAWAVGREDAANAAVGFDPDTLAPTYTLAVGAPGASHAIQIAERLGLDPDLVAAARGALDPGRRRLDGLLAEAERSRHEADLALAAALTERRAAEASRTQAERVAEDLAARADAARVGAERERAALRAEAERELSSARAELAELRRAVADARRLERRRASGRGTESERERDRRLGDADRAATRAGGAIAALSVVAAPAGPLQVGDMVVDSSGLRGEIVEIEGARAAVRGQLGVVRVPLDRLIPDARARISTPLRQERRPEVQACAPEIDVRGRRAAEARAAVREHLDRAALAGLASVRVVHGRGTGALRVAVREELARHPLAASVEDAPLAEGGEGATIVTLAG